MRHMERTEGVGTKCKGLVSHVNAPESIHHMHKKTINEEKRGD